YGGMFETNDGGRTYNRMGIPGAKVHDIVLTQPSSKNILYHEDTIDQSEHIIAGTDWDSYKTEMPQIDSIVNADLEWGFSGSEGKIGTITRLLEKSPEDENVIYKVNENAISQFLVYKSVDGGENWENITTGVEKPYAMLVHPADPERIYISYWSLAGSGILTSEDAGETWTEISRDEPAQDIVGDPDNPDKIWIGDNDGLHIS